MQQLQISANSSSTYPKSSTRSPSPYFHVPSRCGFRWRIRCGCSSQAVVRHQEGSSFRGRFSFSVRFLHQAVHQLLECGGFLSRSLKRQSCGGCGAWLIAQQPLAGRAISRMTSSVENEFVLVGPWLAAVPSGQWTFLRGSTMLKYHSHQSSAKSK